MTPCRLIDTRFGNGGILQPGTPRSFPITQCEIPAGAKAYSFKITAGPSGPLGYLTVWPTGQPQPATSTPNAGDGQVTANGAIFAAGTGGFIDVFALSATHLVTAVNGYFDMGAALSFLPA